MAVTKKEPRVAVFCRCGAAWFGKYVRDNDVIAAHQAKKGCGPLITADEYEQGTYGEARKIKWPAGWTPEEQAAVRAGAA
jgi:hypothetical protein